MSQFDKIVIQMERDHPDWQCWTVHRAVSQPRVLWCAKRWDGTGDVIHAGSSGELERLLEQEQEQEGSSDG
jgi:hypothetical protein